MHGSGWGTLLAHYQEAVATAGVEEETA